MTVAIFCGSREWTDPEPIRKAMERLEDGSIIVHGDQRGADLIAGTEASRRGFEISALKAMWDIGLQAGPMRNSHMLKRLIAAAGMNQAVKTFAFHHDSMLGVGTRDMVQRCLKARVRVDAFLSCDSESVRVSGNVVCEVCGSEYWRHPLITSILTSDEQPFLHLGCDGKFLKL